MKTTTIKTTNHDEFKHWRNLLDKSGAEYTWRSEPDGEFIKYIMILNHADAVNVLRLVYARPDAELAQQKAVKKGSKSAVVTFLLLIGLAATLFISTFFSGNNETEVPVQSAANTPLKMDYLSIIGKSKEDMIAKFGEPVYRYKMSDRKGAERLIWSDEKGNDFEIRFDGKTAFAFTWNDYEAEAPYNVLMAVGMPQQSPDFSNGNLKRWDDINGFKLLVTKLDGFISVYIEKKTM